MAVLRKRKKNNYTVIDNDIFKNRKMSLKAKGLLCLMLSLPDDWEYSLEGLTVLSDDGRTAVSNALKELENLQYFKRQRIYENGRVCGVEYIISEEPMDSNLISEKLISETMISEKPTQLNTNTNKELKELNTNYEQEFDSLWKLYPNKKGKKNALRYYIRARKNGTTYETVEAGIMAYIEYIRKTKAQMYIKHGSTFFNEEGWNDDWSVGTPTLPQIDTKPVTNSDEFKECMSQYKGVYE